MRLALLSLLMVPLVVGCGAPDKDDDDDVVQVRFSQHTVQAVWFLISACLFF